MRALCKKSGLPTDLQTLQPSGAPRFLILHDLFVRFCSYFVRLKAIRLVDFRAA